MGLGDVKIASCVGKQQYQTRALARKIAGKSKYPLEAYKCIHCGLYHVGGRVNYKKIGKK